MNSLFRKLGIILLFIALGLGLKALLSPPEHSARDSFNQEKYNGDLSSDSDGEMDGDSTDAATADKGAGEANLQDREGQQNAAVTEALEAKLKPSAEDNEKSQKERFQWALAEMSKCIGVQTVVDDKLEPSLSDLESTLLTQWGGYAANSEDWAGFEQEMPDGSRRRLKIETDYDFGYPPIKKLKVYSQRGDNPEIAIDIPKEHAESPTDGILDSYKAEGKIISQDLGGRAYFKDGQEVTYVTKNGKFSQLEIETASKSFRCSQMQTKDMACACTE